MQITTVTQKGQVTIPVAIRKKHKIQPGSKVLFFENEERVEMKPLPDFFSFRGALRSKKKFDIKAMRKAAQKHVAGRYIKTLK